MPRTAQSRGRGSLTREGVLRAAVELADAEGIDALTMRSLARHLGVEAMSLYHHVANKDEILDAMVDRVFAEFHAPVVGQPWREQLRLRSVTGRAVLLRHPWAVGLMDSRRTPSIVTLRHHDAVIGCLRAAGFSLALVSHAFAVLDAHLYGFIVQELSLPFTGPEELGDLADEMLTAIPAAQLPHFVEFATQYAMAPGYSFADEFEIGLDLILDALQGRLDATSPGG